MLFLLFQIGHDRYALGANLAVEVIPFLELKRLANAPRGVAGIFNFRGQPIVAVDLCALTLGRPARELLSTRIIVVDLPPTTLARGGSKGLGSQRRWVGLIAEHATGMMRREPDEFVNSGIKPDHAPYLGPVAMDDQGVIQLLRTENLLPEGLSQAIFHEISEPCREAG